jgi:hypothetical protein
MENHTKRIRKARRQGLATKKDLAPPTRRLALRGRGMQGPDVPGEPRANARKKTAATHRKTKRSARSSARRMRSPAARSKV